LLREADEKYGWKLKKKTEEVGRVKTQANTNKGGKTGCAEKDPGSRGESGEEVQRGGGEGGADGPYIGNTWRH
jgi:hypothetical protein